MAVKTKPLGGSKTPFVSSAGAVGNDSCNWTGCGTVEDSGAGCDADAVDEAGAVNEAVMGGGTEGGGTEAGGGGACEGSGAGSCAEGNRGGKGDLPGVDGRVRGVFIFAGLNIVGILGASAN
jgi:hypothetical protein